MVHSSSTPLADDAARPPNHTRANGTGPAAPSHRGSTNLHSGHAGTSHPGTSHPGPTALHPSPTRPDRHAHTTRHAVDVASAVALVILWSSGFVGARLGADHASPDTLLAWRLIASAAVLLAWTCLRNRVRRTATPAATPLRGRRTIAEHAVVGVLTQAAFLGGVYAAAASGVAAGTSALVAALQPLVVAAAAGPLLGRRVSIRQWLGLVVGLAGVALVVADDVGTSGTPIWAYVLPFGAMLALSAGTVLDRYWQPAGSTVQALTIHVTASAALVVAVAALTSGLTPPSTPGFWWSVAWVTVLSGFGGYGAYLVVARRSGATHVSVLLYLTPPTTLIWTWLMFDEGLGWHGLAGLVVCATGVILFFRTTPRGIRRISRKSHHGPPAPSSHPGLARTPAQTHRAQMHDGPVTHGQFLSPWWPETRR